jgi:S-adenosylmethionine:tRNA ribosyltransferase-isomerase
MSAAEVPVPVRLEAHEPPEVRGDGRDDVALLVSSRTDGELVHARFRELPRFLAAGDLLVVNASATLPAGLDATLDGEQVQLRLSTAQPGGLWIVEVRTADGQPRPVPSDHSRLELVGGGSAELIARFAGSGRLAIASLDLDATVEDYLSRYGRPIRYGYVHEPWPISAYQTVFAVEPGSAEMPSAGRPFTTDIVAQLVSRGVLVAPIVLHTGLSSPERGEPPYPERFRVPATTAALVNAVHGWRGRVIAVGTTVVRALETVAAEDGTVSEGQGWTGLVVTPEGGLRTVDGLLTGLHEAESSHLQMLEAVAGAELLDRSYRSALECGYLWHEFGDVHLILP